jgi:hypothetical protein
MALERIGSVAVAADRLRTVFPNLRPGDRQAIADISISNRMSVATSSKPHLALLQRQRDRRARLGELADANP